MGTISTRRTTGAAVLAALVAVMMLLAVTGAPLVAAAATFNIELPDRIIYPRSEQHPQGGVEGQRRDLGTFAVPAEMVGLTCTVAALGNNNESVNPGNNIEVSSVNTVVLVGVEDAVDKDTIADGQLTLGESVTFTLVLGPTGAYSAGFLVVFDCPDETEETTTTTTEPEETTTTTAPEPEETTTTTAPEPEETTTTTTTEVEATTTTTTVAGESTTTTSGETDDTLPFTGVESGPLALLAALALAAGSGLVLTTRNSSEARREDLAG